MDALETLQSRLRNDLMAAMRGRRDIETRVLRAMLAAIDDAQAVPVGRRHDTYVLHAFGEAGVEVPRLDLAPNALETLFRRERQERLHSAEQMRDLRQPDRAAMLTAEADIIARFLPVP